jgi:hypothetical protein
MIDKWAREPDVCTITTEQTGNDDILAVLNLSQ